jgi:hypothetical protein
LEFQKTLRVPAFFLRDGWSVARGAVPLLAGQFRVRTWESYRRMNQVLALHPLEIPAGVHGAVQMSVQRATLIAWQRAAKAALERSNVATAQPSAWSGKREALHVAAV